MQVSRHAGLALLWLWMLACTNTRNTPADAASPVDRHFDAVTDASDWPDVAPDAANFHCGWPSALDKGALSMCAPARAFVTCTLPSGSASYSATEPGGCISCTGTCQDSCAVGEFALTCGTTQPDAALSSGPAHGCHFAATFSAHSQLYCCPCQ